MSARRFLLIRHGTTQNNLERRYVSGPEEPLCPQGVRGAKRLAQSGALAPISVLMCAPALRCRQTAELLFPGMPHTLCPMRELDFGLFAGKNADELLGDADYERWLAGGCMEDVPGGESVAAFKERCCDTFEQIAQAGGEGTTGLVIHGGNIMAVMERFALPKKDFYAYRLPNCGFYLCRRENGGLYIEAEGGVP